MDAKKYGNSGLKFCLPGGELVFSRELVISVLVQLGVLGFIALYFGILNAAMTFIAFCLLFGIFHSIGFLQVRIERIREEANFKRKN